MYSMAKNLDKANRVFSLVKLKLLWKRHGHTKWKQHCLMWSDFDTATALIQCSVPARLGKS